MNLFVDSALPQRSGPLRPTFVRSFPLKKVTWLAPKCTAQFAQDVCAVHFRAVVGQPEQRGIANARFLPQTVQRPSLLRKDLSKSAGDHSSRVAGANCICQLTFIYKLWFTLERWRSRLVVSRKGLRIPSLLWKTTIKLRAGALRTSPDFPAFAAEAQP
jgi:hypothetical protein